MKTKSRFPKYLVIAVCAVVLVISVVIVFGTWSFVSKASTTVVELLTTVEKTALTVGNALDRVTLRLDQAHGIAQEFQSTTLQISQNVKDQGIILTLLPLVKDQQLKDAVQSIQDTFAGLKDTLGTFASWVDTIRKIPFLGMVGLDTSLIQNIGDKIAGLQATAEKITSSAAQIRAQAAGGVEKVSTAVGNFDAQLTDINSSLTQVRSQVEAVQTTAGQLKSVIPTLFTTFAFLITLFLAWVIYSQIVLLRRAVLELKSIRDPGIDYPAQDNKLNPGKEEVKK
jgi:predicted PurR-regulated permease PerM